MKYDQVILEKNAYYEILNIKWRYEFIKVHGKQEVLRYGKLQKAAVIGCGFVGSTIAYTLMQKGLFSEMVLLDANKAKAKERRWISATDCRLHMNGYLCG